MKEQNNDTLKKAIRQLPSYTAPPGIWEAIQTDMEIFQKEAPLREATHNLPVYKAPEGAWAGIAQQLKEEKPQRHRALRIRQLGIAASVAILVAAGGYFFWNTDAPATVELEYRKELVNLELLENDWEQDQEDMQWVVQQFEKSPVAKTEKQYETLLIEYAELNDAKHEIENVMKNYGKDASLIRQMTRIELERTRIIKQMATLI
jgi:hypothetical protein